MEFQFAQYANAEQTSINATMADGQQVSIPAIEGNRHYRALMEWVQAGNAIADYVEPEQPMAPLSAEQFWTAAEIKLGIDQDAALAIVAQMPSSTEAEIEAKVLAKNLVTKGTKFEINHPVLQSLVTVAGISQTQLKAAWVYGLTVKY